MGPFAEIRWDDYEGRIGLAMLGACDVADIPRVCDAGRILECGGLKWQVMFNGLRMKAGGYYGDWMSSLIEKLEGFHEPQEERVFHNVLNCLDEPRSMIELGAYWAWYSLWFKSRFPDATAIAVEPDPHNLSIAAANAAENGLELVLELGGVIKPTAETIGQVTIPASPHCQVPAVTVSGIMIKHGLEQLDILHADIQSAELGMLQDARQLLDEKRINHIFVSTHGDRIHQNCRKLLIDFDYRIIAEHTPAESFSFDGLLVAQSPDLPLLDIRISRRSTTGREV